MCLRFVEHLLRVVLGILLGTQSDMWHKLKLVGKKQESPVLTGQCSSLWLSKPIALKTAAFCGKVPVGIFMCVKYVYVYTCHSTHVVVWEQNRGELTLSFHQVDPRNQIQAISLGVKGLFPVSHLHLCLWRPLLNILSHGRQTGKQEHVFKGLWMSHLETVSRRDEGVLSMFLGDHPSTQ